MRTTLTIMPDFGGAFCWLAYTEGGADEHVGACCSLPAVQRGMRKGPHPLSGKFLRWQSRFEDAYDGSSPPKIDWFRFHQDGLSLARQLKANLGDSYRIIYEKPWEDPQRDEQERREVLLDGSLVDLPSRAQLRAAQDRANGVVPPPPDGKTFEERMSLSMDEWGKSIQQLIRDQRR